jgi:diguanylate cyclase
MQIRGREAGDALRFVRRMYRARMIGLALGATCVAGGLAQIGAPTWVWATLATNALIWPHIAYFLARSSGDPHRAELNNLLADSACGGAWVAAMGFNVVPSAVTVAMLAMDKAAVGGTRFLRRCLLLQLMSALAAATASGFRLELEPGFAAIAASLPLLLIYPVLVGNAAYRLARRVRQHNKLLSALSTIDELTGLLNRRTWERAVQAEFERCRRARASAALLMLDVDRFRTVNEKFGQPAGDAALRALGAIVRRGLRTHDMAGRYDGEEFGIVLATTDAGGAATLAERLRRDIEQAVLEPKNGVRSTVCIGYAELERGDWSYLVWMDRARRALYRAKVKGRNRCAAATSDN